MIMNLPMITWISIVAILLCGVIAKLLIGVSKSSHKLLELGSEREELYLPGDPLAKYEDEYAGDDEI